MNTIDAGNDIYNTKEFAKNRPIKGLLQVVKIILFLFALLLLIAIVTDSGTALALLGGIGGMTAVILLIFKDSILGLVAGIQLSADNLLSLGDWIEMPKYSADGEVVDIALTKIVVRNFDKTYTTIPAYRFLEDSFKNWKGMSQSGGRRIKRSLTINMATIKFLSMDDIKKLSKIDLLKEYLEEKSSELENHNKNNSNSNNFDETTDLRANGRYLTNIGTFRAYMYLYLKNHPDIHQENFTLLVRQLASTEIGVPIEIYCFVNDTNWNNYEGIQSDIFDHMLAVIHEFNLKVYQTPSGDDLTYLLTNNS
jgi:miniconductance mechanosensitive channel